MAFTEQEKQIVLWGKANGKTQEEVERALVNYRAGYQPPAKPTEPAPTASTSILQRAKSVLTSAREAVLPNPENPEAAQQQGLIPVKGPFSGKDMYIDPTGSTVASSIKRVGGAAIQKVAGVASKAADAVAKTVSGAIPKGVAGGATQTVSELAERVPRFVGRMKENMQEAADRAARIEAAPPVVKNAIKTNLDDRIIRTVEEADEPTARAYKEIVDLAENTGKTLRVADRPEIVAGRVAEAQYKSIDQQRKKVGKEIGEAVKALSKTTSVDLTPGLYAIDDVLGTQGIKVARTGTGTKLDFAGSRFTPAERTKIQQLYDLASEGGGRLSPAQIHGKDQLFSKLQRESRFEGIGDIIVETPEGNMSLFRVFRDMYSNMLDEVSPEDIRALNRQYRNLVTLTDDIENSIVKGGNFETVKNIDGAEFAQTNLRRILSDAQSAAAYRGILEEMDKFSRQYGYSGPRADDLVAFAAEIRKLYDSAIPATSFQGGIRASLSDAIQSIANIGKPTAKDQQKALRELIETRIKEAVPTK